MSDRLKALKDLLAKVEAEKPIPVSAVKTFGLNRKSTYASDAVKGSLDAAKALHEAVLPEFRWVIRNGDEDDLLINGPNGGPDKFFANVFSKNPNVYDVSHFPSWADNPARAWFCAILKALIAMEEDNE